MGDARCVHGAVCLGAVPSRPYQHPGQHSSFFAQPRQAQLSGFVQKRLVKLSFLDLYKRKERLAGHVLKERASISALLAHPFLYTKSMSLHPAASLIAYASYFQQNVSRG